MRTFFPTMERPAAEVIVPPEEIPWEPITAAEVEKAVKRAKKNTAPGEDELPTLVWQQLWPYVSDLVLTIFTASLNLGYYPQRWKTAKIVVLRKPAKADYTNPSAYRPISLLNTLGKILEGVIARRLSYYAEAHRLLPSTQFGGRPGRNTEQALLVLTNAIDQAWLRSKVVTLVAFDLKGAFNGVNHATLDARLREKKIPTPARVWIQSFMQGRRSSIHFDGFSTETAPLEHAGLAQGSPLSPILFAFFNADLVDQDVNTQGGASAYIDDYFRWVVGRSAEENLHRLQQEDIPRITQWAQRTGSAFSAEKTELIHLTRRKKELCHGSISMGGKVVAASPVAKLLGVLFDQELRWKEHVQRAVKQATVATLGMSGLRHLRPAQMRQVYQACILPKLEYASTVWHNPLKDKMHLRALGTVQRAALLRVVSAFKTVATQTLEVECHILPLHLRLKQRGQDVVVRLCTLPPGHPLAKVAERVKQRVKRKGTHSSSALIQTMRSMERDGLDSLETIDPTPLAPWSQSAFASTAIEHDKIQALEDIEEVMKTPQKVIFTDASSNDSGVGAAVVMLDPDHGHQQTAQIGLGSAADWTVHTAELVAIHQATEMIKAITVEPSQVHDGARAFTIITDSQSAIRAITCPSSGSGQHIVRRILQQVGSLREHKVQIHLLWTPAHAGVEGNEMADQLAKQAASLKTQHDYHRPVSTYRGTLHRKIVDEWRHEWHTSQKGKHLKKIDDGFPARRALRAYSSLTRRQTYLLVQLRTGHSWLATFAKLFGFRDDNKCVCGAVETVVHVVVDCPRLGEARKKLRDQVGDAFSSIATLLGGRNGHRQVNNAGRERNVVQAVLEFAEASQRFTSRAPATETRGQHRP